MRSQSMGTTVEIANDLFSDQSLLHRQRLIVLVPDIDFDEIVFGKAVWHLAAEPKKEVEVLAVVRDPDSELRAVHRTTALAAVIRDTRIRIRTHIVYHRSWLAALRGLWRPGDLLVCLATHQVRVHLLGKQPAGQFLAGKLGAQCLILPSSNGSSRLGRT